jgi:GT2 family glycosyltransferase
VRMTAHIAVVVPTHQRKHSLARVLDGLSRQTCPEGLFTVVVICDGCTDGTAEMLHGSRYPFRLEVIEQSPGMGPAAARNRALSVIDAPLVVFLDDDVVPHQGFISVHAKHHARDPNVVVIGPLLAPKERQQPWIRWEAETLRDQYAAMQGGAWTPTPRQFYTGNASVARSHVLEAGRFDERLTRGEDVDLAFRLQRLGLRFRFEPAAAADHIACRTFHSWVAAANEYGRTEFAMGPVWGVKGLVDVKVIEFKRRHPAVRAVVRAGLANPRLMSVLIGAARFFGSLCSAARLWAVARGAYTTIFEMAYWSGVEQAAGRSGDMRLIGSRERM